MRRFIISMFVAATTLASAHVAVFAAPPMWLVSDEDSRVWLFGALHALPEHAEWRTEAFDEALREADLYYYEARVDAEGEAQVQAAVMRLGLNPPGEQLSSYLNDADVALLHQLARTYGVPVSNLEIMRPWLAGLALSVGAMQLEGFSTAAGIESILQPETRDRDERYFETPAEQLHFFADLSHDVQVGALVETLHQLTAMENIFQGMFEAWQAGDVEALDAALDALEMTDYPQVREVIIVERNKAWVEDIADFMTGSDDALIVVGAGHLIGDDAVPDLLQARGFTVERVQ